MQWPKRRALRGPIPMMGGRGEPARAGRRAGGTVPTTAARDCVRNSIVRAPPNCPASQRAAGEQAHPLPPWAAMAAPCGACQAAVPARCSAAHAAAAELGGATALRRAAAPTTRQGGAGLSNLEQNPCARQLGERWIMSDRTGRPVLRASRPPAPAYSTRRPLLAGAPGAGRRLPGHGPHVKPYLSMPRPISRMRLGCGRNTGLPCICPRAASRGSGTAPMGACKAPRRGRAGGN